MGNKISIIVPVYKVEKYLDRCMESIVNQDYENLEIILVDDGSPDHCPQMCDSWAEKDSRIRVIHKENGGLSSARNCGLNLATGDFLYFVDSDDYIDRSLCTKLMDLFAEHDADIIAFNSCHVGKDGTDLGATEDIREEMLSQADALAALLQGKINSYQWNKMYRRQIFDGIRFPEGRVWEDVAVSYRLFLNAKQVYCYPEQLYYYCDRDGSIVASINEKMLGDIYLARYESFVGLKDYNQTLRSCALGWTALAALNLYDRSLWAEVDRQILKDALEFLSANRGDILKENKNMRFRLYYAAPWLYKQMRLGKHAVGTVVKQIRRK